MLTFRSLDYNLITQIESNTFCNVTTLENLHISNNQIMEAAIADDAFSCLGALKYL